MTGPAYLLLLLPLDFFSPPMLLRLLLALVLPLARSLWASPTWLLALAPLLAASDRPLLPGEVLELRDAIEMLLDSNFAAGAGAKPQFDSRSGLRAFCRL